MYEVAPAVREGYSWARSNLHNIRYICTVGVVMFVGAYVWGQAQLRKPSARAWRSVFPSRRHPVTYIRASHCSVDIITMCWNELLEPPVDDYKKGL